MPLKSFYWLQSELVYTDLTWFSLWFLSRKSVCLSLLKTLSLLDNTNFYFCVFFSSNKVVCMKLYYVLIMCLISLESVCQSTFLFDLWSIFSPQLERQIKQRNTQTGTSLKRLKTDCGILTQWWKVKHYNVREVLLVLHNLFNLCWEISSYCCTQHIWLK